MSLIFHWVGGHTSLMFAQRTYSLFCQGCKFALWLQLYQKREAPSAAWGADDRQASLSPFVSTGFLPVITDSLKVSAWNSPLFSFSAIKLTSSPPNLIFNIQWQKDMFRCQRYLCYWHAWVTQTASVAEKHGEDSKIYCCLLFPGQIHEFPHQIACHFLQVMSWWFSMDEKKEKQKVQSQELLLCLSRPSLLTLGGTGTENEDGNGMIDTYTKSHPWLRLSGEI